MNTSLDNKRKVLTALYFLGIIAIPIIMFIISSTKQNHITKPATYMSISNALTLDQEGTLPVSPKELGNYMDPEIGWLSIYYQLPEMHSEESLIYRSKDIYTRVLIDGQLIYEPIVYESPLYNESPGNLWNIVPITTKYSGKCLELQIGMIYDTNTLTLDTLFFGNPTDFILNFLKNNQWGLLVSLIMIIVGLFFMIYDFLPTYGKIKKHHSLFWIGFFAFLVGIWSLLETNLLQFWFDDVRIIQLINNMITIVLGMPLLFYLNCEYGIFKYRVMRILAYINVGYILLCFGLHLSNIRSVHYTLNGGHILMILSDVVLFIWVVYTLIKCKKEKKPILNCALQLSGLCMLWIFGIAEYTLVYQEDRIDRAGLLRIGMLLLCLFLAISSQIETYKVIERGLKYNFVRDLAYSDGLTGVSNRTAYLEQLEKYNNNDTIGIVFLDINNLKKINDTLGHEYGDELIITSANIIYNSFGLFGKVFRIGGDEFCVLIDDNNVKSKYELGLETFKKLINEMNGTNQHPYMIQIAHGFSVCESATQKKLSEAIAKADSKMYKNKKEQKSNYA